MTLIYKSINTILILLSFSLVLYAQDEFFEPHSTIGGYGELHYNDDRTNDKKILDFHRFVLFYGYTWNDKWSFNSEVELEHNFVKGGQGELELEQAYIDFHPSEYISFQVGVVLPSVGLVNEYHEPPRFLSVERPDYAKNIIPTTWFGNGASVYGSVKGFEYKATIMEGLNADNFSASSGIRGGLLKGYKSNAEELLYNFRLDYTGQLGARVGLSYSYNDALSTTNGTIGTSIFEAHARYQAHNIYSVLEYGKISYDTGDLESSKGFYIDLGYNVGSFFNFKTELIPWFRYTDHNTAHKTKAGGDQDKEFHFTKWMVGLSVKPIPSVVFKIDYGVRQRELDDAETKLFNLGAGYMF